MGSMTTNTSRVQNREGIPLHEKRRGMRLYRC